MGMAGLRTRAERRGRGEAGRAFSEQQRLAAVVDRRPRPSPSRREFVPVFANWPSHILRLFAFSAISPKARVPSREERKNDGHAPGRWAEPCGNRAKHRFRDPLKPLASVTMPLLGGLASCLRRRGIGAHVVGQRLARPDWASQPTSPPPYSVFNESRS